MFDWWQLSIEQRIDTYTLAELETGVNWWDLSREEQARYIYEAEERYADRADR